MPDTARRLAKSDPLPPGWRPDTYLRRMEAESALNEPVFRDGLLQHAQAQLEHAQLWLSPGLESLSLASLQPCCPQTQRQHCRKRHQQQQPHRVHRVPHMTLLPVEALALLVPEQLLGPEPLGVGSAPLVAL